jgi:hypothetical protein
MFPSSRRVRRDDGSLTVFFSMENLPGSGSLTVLSGPQPTFHFPICSAKANMAKAKAKPVFSSGIESLDEILQGVLAGDNVVWQVDAVEDQIPFVSAFCRCAHLDGKKLIYFRFGEHQPLVPDNTNPRCTPSPPGRVRAVHHHHT